MWLPVVRGRAPDGPAPDGGDIARAVAHLADVSPRLFTSDDKTVTAVVGLAVALAAGIFEELGWTGFAIPTLAASRCAGNRAHRGHAVGSVAPADESLGQPRVCGRPAFSSSARNVVGILVGT